MNQRIKILRKDLNLNQEEFASKLGIARSHISSIENGARTLTERTIKDICREFNVNESWLRTGKGEMFKEMNSDEELALLMGKIIGNDNQFVKDAMLALARLDEKDWDFIKHLMDKIKK